MSDSDSDEKSGGFTNGNYKSPSKRKRHKGEVGTPSKTYQFEICLTEKNGDEYTEVSYLDLVAKEEQRLRKLSQASKDPFPKGGLDPYASDDDDQLKAMAASFEAKYGEKPKTKKIGKLGGKKRKIHDYDDLGIGYDETDPFIDNSECFDEVVPQEITTAHGGFYINTGALEFKENKNAIFNLSSDEETPEEKEKKAKKKEKKETKKQVKFKEKEEKSKPKVKNTDVKRKPRIINTDPNIRGPKGGNKPGKKKQELKPGGEQSKPSVKTKADNKAKSDPTQSNKAGPQKPKDHSSVNQNAPELVDLARQLDAFSKTVEQSKGDAIFSKPANSTKSSSPVPSSPLQDLKLPSSVRISKVESSQKTSKKNDEGTPKSKPPPKSSPKVSTSSSSVSWQNLVNFSSAPFSSSISKVNNETTKATNSIYQNSKLTKEVTKNVPSSVSIQSSPKQAPDKNANPPMFTGAAVSKPGNVPMFHHDPQNILSAAVTTMSSILGTTGPYFAQKLQEKSIPSSDQRQTSQTSVRSSPKTTPSISSSPKVASPIDLSSVVSSLGISSPSSNIQQSISGMVHSKASPVSSPNSLSDVRNSNKVAQLPKTLFPSNPENVSRSGVLSAEMTQSLLGIAEHMMNDMQQPTQRQRQEQLLLEQQRKEQIEKQKQEQLKLKREQQRQEQILKEKQRQEKKRQEQMLLDKQRQEQVLLEKRRQEEIEKQRQQQLALERQRQEQEKQRQEMERQKQEQLLKEQQIMKEKQRQEQMLLEKKRQEQQRKEQQMLLEKQRQEQIIKERQKQEQILKEQQRQEQILKERQRQEKLKQEELKRKQQEEYQRRKQEEERLKMAAQASQSQQHNAYMNQFQQFATQQQNPKKSAAYEISSLLNSQPLPLHGSPSPSSRSSSQSPNIVGRAPVFTQQQQVVNLQQQQGLPGQYQASSKNPVSSLSSQIQQPMSALPPITSITGQNQLNLSQAQPQFQQQQINSQPFSNQQNLTQQQQQALLQNYYLGGGF